MQNLITELGQGKVVWRACERRSTGDRTGRVRDGNPCMAPPAGRRPSSHSCWHILHRYVQLIRLPLYPCKLLPWVKTRLQKIVYNFIHLTAYSHHSEEEEKLACCYCGKSYAK